MTVSTTPLNMRTRVELLLYNTMKYNKSPLDYPDILAMLKDRNLQILDEDLALSQLHIIGYFRLANYLRPMELDKQNHIFKENSFFENAIDLYYFDKDLRALLFTAIQTFEIALRAKVIHHFSIKYGPFWLIDANLFSDKKIFSDCQFRIQQEVNRSKEDFIQQHFEKYEDPIIPPSWKTLEIISFGTLSKILCNLKDSQLKKIIAKEFGLPQHKYLESWCKSAVSLRNNLAHHSRAWNRIYPIHPQLPRYLAYPWVDTTTIPNNRLYAQICCLAYLQDIIHPNNSFKERLQDLLACHPNVDVKSMGFQNDWREQPLWS